MNERLEVLINRIRHLREEIRGIFSNTEYWNRIHPAEELIDPDPDGLLQRMALALDKTLAGEKE